MRFKSNTHTHILLITTHPNLLSWKRKIKLNFKMKTNHKYEHRYTLTLWRKCLEQCLYVVRAHYILLSPTFCQGWPDVGSQKQAEEMEFVFKTILLWKSRLSRLILAVHCCPWQSDSFSGNQLPVSLFQGSKPLTTSSKEITAAKQTPFLLPPSP